MLPLRLIWKQFPVNTFNNVFQILQGFIGFGFFVVNIGINGWPAVITVALVITQVGYVACPLSPALGHASHTLHFIRYRYIMKLVGSMTVIPRYLAVMASVVRCPQPSAAATPATSSATCTQGCNDTQAGYAHRVGQMLDTMDSIMKT